MNPEQKNDNNSEEEHKDYERIVAGNLWKVRDCLHYEYEYKQCNSFRGKFHQYFINGEYSDCSDWKNCMKNCKKCMENDLKACAKIIYHEDERRKNRINAHLANDVWAKRKEPPPNWHSELPAWFYEKHKNSYLSLNDTQSSCTIF